MDAKGAKDTGNSKNLEDGSSSMSPTATVPADEKPREILPLLLTIQRVVDTSESTTESSAKTGVPVTAPTILMANPDEFVDMRSAAVQEQVPEVHESAAPPQLDLEPISTPTTQTGDLAFAARFVPSESASAFTEVTTAALAEPKPRLQLLAQTLQRQGLATSVQAQGESAENSTQPAERFGKPDVAPPLAPEQIQGSPARTEPAAPSHVPSVVRTEPVIEPPAAPSSSSHDFTVRIPSVTDRGTDVRFVERGGEIHVSVRTSDTEMAQSLRSGLNDFVGRLDHEGIRAEVWRPGSAASSQQNDSQNQFDDGRQSGSGRNQSDSQSREDDQPDTNKPRWVEELESLTGAQTNTEVTTTWIP